MEVNRKKIIGNINKIQKTSTHYCIDFGTGEEARLYILNDHVFRYYMSPSKLFSEYPRPLHESDVAKISTKDISEYGTEAYLQSQFTEIDTFYIIKTNEIQISFDKIKGTINIHDNRTNKEVLCEAEPLSYDDCKSKQTLLQRDNEHFFGGGMQNGRFNHKGECIEIENTNNWTDGGVSSPCPFYWSTSGYGILRNTWLKGWYDFGSKSNGFITTIHVGEDFDAFIFVNSLPKDILSDYYELTGKPQLLPEYALYEAHFASFNSDYWFEVYPESPGAILFEDGYCHMRHKAPYIEDTAGILGSLNGENDNYQFSARAMIDRYKKLDLPLGWIIPNDRCGSGYGQTSTLDGDIQNLKQFSEYCNENGIKLGLWMESKLLPADPTNPQKGERDFIKEISEGNAVAFKCDAGWIGCGYSYGLTVVETVGNIFMTETNNSIRPMIITVSGWAGTQRYAGIWSGNQLGGNWENIRFQIPSYIGAGLSGQPIVGSDIDGIYAGGNKTVNIRDYQWKSFTPLQFNMDGWGYIRKTPFSHDMEATMINRAYLKLKSSLMPYNYTIAHESLNGLPMVRAMFLEYPGETCAYALESQYQFMWGPNILVAPIYDDVTFMNKSLRNGIYLPDVNQIWIDFFTGEKYQGGKIYNNIIVPLWKMPIFIKEGCIIPMTNPNNNPSKIERDKRIFMLYPSHEERYFTVYEDDGINLDYQNGYYTTTEVSIKQLTSTVMDDLEITINKTVGSYRTMIKERSTVIKIIASRNIDSLEALVNGEAVQMLPASNVKEFNSRDNCYIFDKKFIINPYLSIYRVLQKFLLIKIHKVDVTESEIVLKIKKYENKSLIFGKTAVINENLTTPSDIEIDDNNTTSSSITIKWKACNDVDFYEIEKDSTIYSNIKSNSFTFDSLKFNSKFKFRIRVVIGESVSNWSEILEACTKESIFTKLIHGVKVICNVACQPGQEVNQLTDGSPNSLWHTNWNNIGKADPSQGRFIKLNFDLGDVYEIDRITYTPRHDVGNGTFLKIKYRYSTDNSDWSPESEPIEFLRDNTIKTVLLHGCKLRYIEFILLSTVGDFGSGRSMLFYKKYTITTKLYKEFYLFNTFIISKNA